MQLFHRYIFGMNQLNKYSVKDENNKEYFGIALNKKRIFGITFLFHICVYDDIDSHYRRISVR